MVVPWARALLPHGRAVGVAISLQPATAGLDAAGISISALGFYLLCAVGVAWSMEVALDAALALVSLAQLMSLIRRARTAPAGVSRAMSRRDPDRYATLLLDVAANARFDQQPKPVSMDDTAIKRRIAMLTEQSKRRTLSVAPLSITAAILATGSLLAPSVFAAGPNALHLAPPHFQTQGSFRTARHTPESSYVACQATNEGDDCPFPTPDGELKGVCTQTPWALHTRS